MTINEQMWLAAIFLAAAGSSLLSMVIYPSWYENRGRLGDTIGAAYHNGRIPYRAFFGVVFAVSAAFWWLPWKHAVGLVVALPFVSAMLLTVFRSRMQWLGFFIAPLGFVAAFLLSRSI